MFQDSCVALQHVTAKGDLRPATLMRLSTVTQDMVVIAQTVQATQLDQTAKDVEKGIIAFQMTKTAFLAIVILSVNPIMTYSSFSLLSALSF